MAVDAMVEPHGAGTGLRLSDTASQRLCCPVCRQRLVMASDSIQCTGCGVSFPVVDGIPVLINEERSIFSLSDFSGTQDTTLPIHRGRVHGLLQQLFRTLPSITSAIGTSRNYARFAELLHARTDAPKVLVIGGGIQGQGMGPLVNDRSIELVASDVSFGPYTAVICDAHDIPFMDDTFDGVVAQAVLEHVVDPFRCVGEIHRVLKRGGLVYAETPFMQQVHMGRYDFTRFTRSGHRRLFRRFEEISGGPICGPGVALAWAYQYFLLSFTSSRALRGLIRAFASLTAFYLKYFDYYLIRQTASFDAASGFFFMGRKGEHTLSDRELIRYYRGALSN